jgi:hypothetical protein
MYFDNREYEDDDEGRPRITPYNAFDVIQQLIAVSNKHDTEITLAWSNLADLNSNRNRIETEIKLLRQAYYEQRQTLDGLKRELIPLLAKLQNEINQILPQENKK